MVKAGRTVDQKKKQENILHGSRKLDGYCLSRMIITEDKNGAISVKYIRTHTNHTPGIQEVKHLPLPVEVREEVRSKVGQHVKLDSIVDGRKY